MSCKSGMRAMADSSSPSSYYLHTSCSGFKVKVAFILLPLLLVSLVVFATDSTYSILSSFSISSSSSSSSSSSLSSSSSAAINGGEGNRVGASKEEEVRTGASVDVLLGSPSSVSTSPEASPKPAPAPEPAPSNYRHNASGALPPLEGRKRKDMKLEKLEHGLAKARAAIREAIKNTDNEKHQMDKDYISLGPIYRNPFAFHRSYLEMEKLFKVYVYEEGEPPIFHDGPCRSIYSSEGRFIHALDTESRFRTRDPDQAHVFFLPFSVVKMVKLIYQPNSHDIAPLRRTVLDYVSLVANRYPFWNRSLGADHFMLSCHDWGPMVSAAVPELYNNSMRALCNANTSEGFNPRKDVSLPEINIKTDNIAEMMGGPSASRRSILAFFAGGNHGPVRSILLNEWKDKDEDIQVHEYLPKGMSYYDKMRMSRFCLCPSGYEVASPRILEAIYLECVPVTINDHYVLPFSDVLNWKSFSVQVSLEDIPNLKKILMSISPRQYLRMQRRLKLVERHFVINSPPKRFDLFNMILHSIWLRRLNIGIHPLDD